MKDAEDTDEMKKWNELVDKNWDHWEYYKSMINFSLQKAANSKLTKHFYPFFYQERLLKKAFVERMQLLGDITEEEAYQFEALHRGLCYYKLYNYYKHPEGKLMNMLHMSTLAVAPFIASECQRNSVSRTWFFLAPIAFIIGSTGLIHRMAMIQFTGIVNMTEWILEKRKAEVWRSQELMSVPTLRPFPALRFDVLFLIADEKMSTITE
ncbi:hypothetical protein SteCoe_5896 [Stentor coeruleus]|uniref:Uncharacterized protein n=1 Tax=Stentor coeruleus TaxID=5963 RepID=A0A1R2CR93_9CILI|nr:hypothetical protein SteCoe_5896 [Stentor coeruleus]